MLVICLKVLACTVGAMIVVQFMKWKRHPETMPCWLFDHDRRYLAMREIKLEQDWHGCPIHKATVEVSVHFYQSRAHYKGELIYYARWSCRRCPEMGEECFGSKQDWKIEHEKVVPDTKKWANWSKPL